MEVVRTIVETRASLAGRKAVALVPTMGALHDGHLSLVAHARGLGPCVVVSIFVNPTQFAPGEDFERYPRPVERDLQMCREAGVDVVFLPEPGEIYPPSEAPLVIDVPHLTTLLEGANRPGHFVGVCRVVTKLFNIVRPDVACFGLKDYQQYKVIEAMTAGMSLPIRIEGCPIIRESDGLAMSSRNAYLNTDQRRHAVGIHKALAAAESLIRDGESDVERVESAMRQVIASHRFEIDYAVVRDARTLGEVDVINPRVRPVVCLAAARLGAVRLIDNIVIAPSES